MTPVQLRKGMSRFKAAEDAVNRMLLKEIDIERHWRESNIDKANKSKEVQGLHGENTKSTGGN
jgi:hypothetical protein